MLLHGDLFLNEGAGTVVGVGDLDWGGIIHRLFVFSMFLKAPAARKDRGPLLF